MKRETDVHSRAIAEGWGEAMCAVIRTQGRDLNALDKWFAVHTDFTQEKITEAWRAKLPKSDLSKQFGV